MTVDLLKTRASRTIKSMSKEIAIILPCYNEAHRIAESLPELYNWRQKFEEKNSLKVHILFANDGCKDKTVEIITQHSKSEKNVKIVGYEKNQGRGAALKVAYSEVPPASLFALYMDADLATDLRHIQDVLNAYDKQGSKLVVCGNRYYPSNNLKRPLLRKIWSWGWRNFLSTLFWTKLPDTQCGFKAFSKDLIPNVLLQLKLPGFVADVEMILRAQNVGATIHNIDIIWTEKKGSTIRWSTVFKMFAEVLYVRRHLNSWIKSRAS